MRSAGLWHGTTSSDTVGVKYYMLRYIAVLITMIIAIH
jgi:hypothetical protein